MSLTEKKGIPNFNWGTVLLTGEIKRQGRLIAGLTKFTLSSQYCSTAHTHMLAGVKTDTILLEENLIMCTKV